MVSPSRFLAWALLGLMLAALAPSAAADSSGPAGSCSGDVDFACNDVSAVCVGSECVWTNVCVLWSKTQGCIVPGDVYIPV